MCSLHHHTHHHHHHNCDAVIIISVGFINDYNQYHYENLCRELSTEMNTAVHPKVDIDQTIGVVGKVV